MYRQWIIIAIVLASAQDSSGLIGNACYGTNIACDFYSLQCPEGEIIHLNNLLAGGKSEPTCRSEQHCSGGLDCCSYSQGDLTSIFDLENTYHTYRNCSGRQSCAAIQAPWQRLDTQTFSSYVQIEYNCERVIPVTPMPSATTRRTTNAPRTTSGSAPLVKDSDDNDTKTKIYLAILVPIAAAIAFGVIFCMWLYWKRNNKRPLKLLHQKKQRTKSEIYRVFSNPKGDNVLEDIIKREHGLRTPSLHGSKPASVFGSDQPSFSHYVSGVPDPYEDAFVVGPSHAHANPIYEYVDDKKSPDGNGPYVIPLNVTEEKPDKLPEPQSNGIRPRTTYIKLKHARPSTKSNVPATSDLTDSTKDIADVYEPGETKGDLQNSANKIPGTPRPIVHTNPDGSVTVHIDNVSNPSVPNSARSTPGASSPVSSRTRSPERGGNGAVIQI
ncbi:hypothetical protein MAR_018413 [Mya arenaria]|uniref:Uncharacterized protein n=1 Tax=Mya arenaria TaxID=6604 RepID=A0ABY7EH67_MYAAR|nr:hypothetical protein MAR_018413 [Mya arenaria]